MFKANFSFFLYFEILVLNLTFKNKSKIKVKFSS